MTQREIEIGINDYKSEIANEFVNMHSYTSSLKYAENEGENKITFRKIKESIDRVNNYYDSIEELERTIPEEDDENTGWSAW